MSNFTGKFDFCDMIEMHGVESVINNYKVYIGDNKTPLRIESVRDLAPYYPHILKSGGFDNRNNTGTVFLTNRSYINELEDDYKKYGIDCSTLEYYRANLKKELDHVEMVYWMKKCDNDEFLDVFYKGLEYYYHQDASSLDMNDYLDLNIGDRIWNNSLFDACTQFKKYGEGLSNYFSHLNTRDGDDIDEYLRDLLMIHGYVENKFNKPYIINSIFCDDFAKFNKYI